ncbi:HD domain-containing protein [Hymenobacter sp. HSC-4F20]|uniref:HD domain-containing protein n=1 Tax=Hymenobacter sp. HSC-4F20 TaxID=2864135 RepID=UPI001C72A6D0|nr:HD domain-containing protein [Hymenobacter sp. HSC-4F20]MBX0292162.1 HD domain-containing protein [Hymenobacter sp. HSC-4F20]
MDYPRAEAYLLHRLHHELPPSLTYHGPHHTLDVLAQAQALAAAEGLRDLEQLLLLRTAALYHDAGFLTTYQGHEAAGCEVVRQVLPGFGYSAAHIEVICTCIMATQVPQNPGACLLARLLCDADLDYLGRSDFWPISRTLFEELRVRSPVADERAWNQIQVQFLTAHHYWTPSALHRRETEKQARLAEIQAWLAAPENQS